MPAFKPETLVSGFSFVEALRVLDDGGVVFSELINGGFFHHSPDGQTRTLVAGRRWVGGAVIGEDGSILLSGEGGLVRLNRTSGAVEPVLSEIDGVPIWAVNDMEADDDGGVYAGTIDFPAILDRGEAGRPGVLFRLAPDGAVDIIREGVVASNGIGFSPDRSVFYHSETTVGVWAYTYSPGGRPRHPALFAKLEDSDGLVVDAEGGVWVACWQTAELRRYRPDGVLDRCIALPAPNVISLAFGGPDLSFLYASTGGATDEGPVGGVIRLRVDTPGQPPTYAQARRGG